MQDALFYIFAASTLICALMVIGESIQPESGDERNVLVLTIASLAGLFVLLHAFFLAAVQVLVYAGAVMVLFLFVIMLLDLKAEERRKVRKFGVGAGLVCVGAILGILLVSVSRGQIDVQENPSLEGGTVVLGSLLFKQYLLPFEIVSLLLLVAMVGVVLLSKKDLK